MLVAALKSKTIIVVKYTRGLIIPFHGCGYLLICKDIPAKALLPLHCQVPFNITWIYTGSVISTLIMGTVCSAMKSHFNSARANTGLLLQ